MADFVNHKALVDAEENGNMCRYTWRKTPSQITTAGLWFDLSMSPGLPAPKYWFDAPPTIAKAISYSEDRGMYHGSTVTPEIKYLRLTTGLATASTALPMTMILCDYLLYYPSCDDSVTNPQPMDNTVTLPRYTDGKGVRVIAISVAGRTGGQSFSFNYTNSDGVSNRTSQTVFQNSSSALGVILNNGVNNNNSAMPFIGLQAGDSGVRSIESVTMNGADVGLFSLVLVKPLCSTSINEITAPVETDYLINKSIIPEIKPDAYLNWVCLPNGTLASTALMGDLKVIWS